MRFPIYLNKYQSKYVISPVKKKNNNKTKPESGSKTTVLIDAHMRFNLTKFSNKVLKKIIPFFSS